MEAGRSYYASYDRGGPGEAGCIRDFSRYNEACNDEDDLVDANEANDFFYDVEAFGGGTQLYFTVSMVDQTRRMEVFVNDTSYGVLEASVGSSPRLGERPNRTAVEQAPFTANLLPGMNRIRLADNRGTKEFDMHRVRLVRMADGTCFDDTQNQDETDLNCGGTICDACDETQKCNVDEDCLSGLCEGNVCLPTEEPEPGAGPCSTFCSPATAIFFDSPNAQGNGSHQGGNLQSIAHCEEFIGDIAGGVCGLSGGRTIMLNGVTMPCNAGWPIPAKLDEGYCVQTSAGGSNSDWFNFWGQVAP
jgi:hypothetical protein